MQSYKYLKKSSVLRPHHFFCQYVSTLNKKLLIGCEDIKRNRKIVEQFYFSLASCINNNRKKENISGLIKEIFISYIFLKKKKKKKNGSDSDSFEKYSFSNVPHGDKKQIGCAPYHRDCRQYHHHRQYIHNSARQNPQYRTISPNDIFSRSFSHLDQVNLSKPRKRTPTNDNPYRISNIVREERKAEWNNTVLRFMGQTPNNIIYPKEFPIERVLTNGYAYFCLVKRHFGKCTKREEGSANSIPNEGTPKKKQEKNDSRHPGEDYKGSEIDKGSENGKRCEIDKGSENGKRCEIDKGSENDKRCESDSCNRRDSLNGQDVERGDEKISVRELDDILHRLEKMYENRNGKINVNIKILVYVFKNFILKNKELKIKILFSFIFLMCSKISIIYTPILLSSFIENVNLEKGLNNKLDNMSFANNSSVTILLAYVLSRVLSSSLNELRNSVFNTISQRISTYVSKLFFYKIHNLHLSYILSKKNGELSIIFNRGCKSITNLLNVIVFQIIPIIVEFILYLYILTYKIHYTVSAVTCLNMLLYIIFTTLVTKRRTIIRKNMNKSEQNTFNIFLDSIQNVEQVKYYTNEIHELRKFVKEQKKYEKEAINVQKSLSFLNFGQQIILNFNLFLCLFLTYQNIANDIFPFSYLILVNTLLFQLAMPLNMFGTIYRETKLSLVDIECMIKILVKKIKSIDYGNKMEIKSGNILFQKVSFKYPVLHENDEVEGTERKKRGTNKIQAITQNFSSLLEKCKAWFSVMWARNTDNEKIVTTADGGKSNFANATSAYHIKNEPQKSAKKHQGENGYIFQNFTCNIEHGEKVAVIGKSGLGKSSLIKLLLKFYEINSGNIYIDNKNIEDINLYTLRKNISIVPQDTILFNNTIKYNIKYGNFHCTDKEMIEASIKSELHEKILNMEKQYNTIVGERGTKLSIGEKQRICIARCFLKNSKIIVLDEHASNLDNENKKLIEKALQKLCLGKTTFIITHVMENMQHMDKIIFFCGKSIYVGNHSEFIRDNAPYREYYAARTDAPAVVGKQ
ncbi:ABC transporter B family member 6, putative [Plasmodium ovale]|uniref:ABC transporter B family member 6, putative n=1 Tax=Plasmodium ovale TaxID=36330 RepID=A0A1C3KUP6_PLAOA|nr:ABC transporter B family member 6, putative [Plasmodium ovale]